MKLGRNTNCYNKEGDSCQCGPGCERCKTSNFENAPQYHVMDETCSENDPNGPFYDP